MYETRDWHAIGTKSTANAEANLHVRGVVDLPNAGCTVKLQYGQQGINPFIIRLELVVTQLDGFWPEVITPRDVAADFAVKTDKTHVDIIHYLTIEIDWS